VKITFINEMADLCEKDGATSSRWRAASAWTSASAASSCNAGPGYGGSCFPKDTLALVKTAQDHGVPPA
jgi:UDPglucose 6-dehydrogenase